MTNFLLSLDGRYACASAFERRGFDVIFTIAVLLGFVGIAVLTATTLTLVFGV